MLRLESAVTMMYLRNAASGAMSRFGICLDFNHWNRIMVVGTWLELAVCDCFSCCIFPV